MALGIISVLNLTGALSGVGFLKTLRTFRALRPLRMISRNPGMKLVVNSLLRAVLRGPRPVSEACLAGILPAGDVLDVDAIHLGMQLG